ncbi:hypothetical protein [Frankia sp. EAN1pec]|uniref:hypothetical protein n=1 Tax=Parafrankia sp. (strain EAN1pec) TaxID=298653 RepID=UPI0012FB5FFB
MSSKSLSRPDLSVQTPFHGNSAGSKEAKIQLRQTLASWRTGLCRLLVETKRRLRELDLRESLGFVLAVLGIAVAIIQMTNMKIAIEVGLVALEVVLISIAFLVIPPRTRTNQSRGQRLTKVEAGTLAAVLVIAVLAPIGAVNRFSERQSRLIVHRYTPVDPVSGELRAGLQAESMSGECWTLSLVSNSADAFRCMSGHFIYDPCFTASWAEAVCIADPWSTEVVRLSLTKDPPFTEDDRFNNNDVPRWALILESGDLCTRVSGMRGAVDGQPVSYSCVSGTPVIGFDAEQEKVNLRSASGSISNERVLVAWI